MARLHLWKATGAGNMTGSSLQRRVRMLGKAVMAGAFCVAIILGGGHAVVAASITLESVASSMTMIWSGVAVVGGKVFVSGPRWSGSRGPAVGLLEGDDIRPFPDQSWNDWTPDKDPAKAFVNVNAIHLDDGGDLWVVDTGTPIFGGAPVPGGAKLVRIDVATGQVVRVYPFGPDDAQASSYIDDIRINGRHAYLTDAGKPGLLVLDVATGALRRVLDGHTSVTAPAERDIVLAGRVLKTHAGEPVRVQSDPMEVSPDGKWLYFAPLEGPWSKIETRYLDDPALPAADLASRVSPWADLPPVGGTAMDRDGSLYFTDLAHDAVRRRAPDGSITTLVKDPRLHWADAPFIDSQHYLWLPVPQLDRSEAFSNADKPREWPVRLFRIGLRPWGGSQ